MTNVKTKSLLSLLIAASMLIFAFRGKYGAIVITCALMIVVLEAAFRKTIPTTGHGVAFAGFLLLFAVGLSIIRTMDFAYYLTIGYLFAACLLLNTDIDRYQSLWSCLKAIALFEALGVYIQKINLDLYYSLIGILLPDQVVMQIHVRFLDGYLTGFTREVSYTMFLIVVGLGLYLFDFQNQQHKKRNVLPILFLALALTISGKKATLLFAVMSLFAVYFLASKNKIKVLSLGAVLCIAVIVLYPVWSKFESMQRFVTLFTHIRNLDLPALTSGRMAIYSYALDLWKGNMLFGIGWGNFRYCVPETYWFSGFDVHNCFLQILCETGIVGLLLYLGMTLNVVRNCIRSIHLTKQGDPGRRSFAFYLSFVQIFFIAYSITEPVLYEYTDYVLYFICINLTNLLIRGYKRRTFLLE